MAYPVMDDRARAVLYYQGAEIELRVTGLSIETRQDTTPISSMYHTTALYLAGPVEAEYQITGVATDSDYTPPPTIDVHSPLEWLESRIREITDRAKGVD